MAFTTRLPEVLQQEAETYASTLGISLNALVAIALRDYLDVRCHRSLSQGVAVAAAPSVEVVSGGDDQLVTQRPISVAREVTPADLQRVVEMRVVRPKTPAPRLSLDADEPDVIPRKVMRSSCWCGSGKELRRCHRRLKLPTD